MEKIDIYSFEGLYRDDFRITGYRFGKGEKSLAVVGSTRGNEFQQLFTVSRLVSCLSYLEERNFLPGDREILVIPSCNPYSMNIKKRFWPTDNTDINRMFPGYNLGETTQRIAAGIFETIKDYENGIQLASFYMSGYFAPHVRVMHTGFENTELAKTFGLPYVIVRRPRPYDTTTLNYNWQIWETNAFSLYTTDTEHICPGSADEAVLAIIRFMTATGIIDRKDINEENEDLLVSEMGGDISELGEPSSVNERAADLIAGCDVPPCDSRKIRVIDDDRMAFVRSAEAGFFLSAAGPGEHVAKGQALASIYSCLDGTKLTDIISPVSGTVLFAHSGDMTYEATTLFKIIPD